MVDVSLPLMGTRVRRLVIVGNLLYAAILLSLGVFPDVPEIAKDVPDFAAHGFAYAAHTALLFALLIPSIGRCNAAVFAVVGAILYGGLVEMLQFLQPTRTVEIRDLGANTIGAAVAASVLYLVTGRERQAAPDE
jgi:VanZ family protein